MKKLLGLTAVALMSASFAASALEKTVIVGDPIVLKQNGTVYELPAGYHATTDYYYIDMSGTKKVCYTTEQTNLPANDMSMITVDVDGKPVQWHCYLYSTTYFVNQ